MLLVVIIVAIVFFMFTGAVLHSTLLKEKLAHIKPYGQLFDVYDGKLHLYSVGNGNKTIVLLPGLAVPLPSADFAPLMRQLSKDYTVACIEYFGVGFSSETSRPRTCENYVEEIRYALKNAGFKPPYVLLPHSLSTVYSEYYASKYPEEVEAVISLEGPSTADIVEMPAGIKHLLPIVKFLQFIGLTSLMACFSINKKHLYPYGYSDNEISDMAAFAGFFINDTLIKQISNVPEFVKQTMGMPFPKSTAYFKVICRKTYETPNKQLKMTPQEYQRRHLERIGENSKCEILDGTHFIYLNNVDRIVEITHNVLKQSCSAIPSTDVVLPPATDEKSSAHLLDITNK
ncbi:MAG TPA: alpha/beta hydrolase [Clostridia bacterium]|nr:alpha/beta hydrolase [Clostridia bacterium]